ncbi:MAG: chorismate synthase [Thermoplasmata archaeon]|nr:chorismate synthase [Thermoplasmata archaeon]
MSAAEFGNHLRLTLTGSSHGPSVGCELRGLPRGTPIHLAPIQRMLDRRSPSRRRLASRRQEPDRLVVDGGWIKGRSTGGVLRLHVENRDARRSEYDRIQFTPRPGHADYTARVRYGPTADLAGGGIFSGRMTVGLVAAGAVAAQLLEPLGVRVAAYAEEIGGVPAEVPEGLDWTEIGIRRDSNEVSTSDPKAAPAMEQAIAVARREGDSVGGVVAVRAWGVPVGLGEPFFDSIESVLAHLAFAIPGVKGVEFGAGFAAARLRGSENNDPFRWEGDRVTTSRNRAGGVLGGLATGMPLTWRIAIKPTPSIPRAQQTVDLRTHQAATIRVGGRHDPCIVPRAVVVAEAVTLFGLADLAFAGGFLP